MTQSTTIGLPTTDFIQTESLVTMKKIKALNVRRTKARTAAERGQIDSEIKTEHDEWWQRVRHLFVRRDDQHSLNRLSVLKVSPIADSTQTTVVSCPRCGSAVLCTNNRYWCPTCKEGGSR